MKKRENTICGFKIMLNHCFVEYCLLITYSLTYSLSKIIMNSI